MPSKKKSNPFLDDILMGKQEPPPDATTPMVGVSRIISPIIKVSKFT